MPIDLYTGQPGNGKTALMMERLIAEAAKGERPIYAAGIDGLDVAGVNILADPRRWNDHDPNGVPTCDCKQDGNFHAHLIPDGSLIFVDEVWKHFGHLQDASRAPNPPHVLALAEHRHRGIDFVWTTQMPNQLYPFARALIADHWHVVRRFGTQFVDVFQWGELNEDVKSQAKRENAQRTTRRLPSAVFDKYKSATMHTIKRKIPFKVLAVPVVLLAGIAALLFAVQHLRAKSMSERLTGKGPDAAQAASAPDASRAAKAAPAYTTAEEYEKFTTARKLAVPWTAPAYDGRPVVSDPKLFCMASGAGRDASGNHAAASCECMTEQGTPYVMPDAMCRTIARLGMSYNPFKAPDDQRNDNGGSHRTVASADATQTPHASGGSSQPFGTMPGYGTLDAK